jgi:hypothetical protein
VEADNRDFALRHPVRRQERLDRLGVHVGDQLLGRREHGGPCAAVGEIGGNRDRAAHDVALGVAVRAKAGRPEPADALAVGLDERHVDPVVGGAAHQADRYRARHAGVLELNPALDLLHHRRKRGDKKRRQA